MNKVELIAAMAARTGLTKTDARKALDAFLTETEQALVRGERVVLVGFGTLSVAKRRARMGRNPQTGVAVPVEAKLGVKYKAGVPLLQTINT